MNINTRVLMLATSKKSRAGITPVLKLYEKTPMWNQCHCKWVATHRDGPNWRKRLYFITGFFKFLCLLPYYNIVHLHMSVKASILRKYFFLRIAKFFGKKTVVHFHPPGMNVFDGASLREKNYKLFSKADAVIVLSKTWKELLISKLNISPDKIFILFNPCEKISNNTHKENIILFAGSIIDRKGYCDLISAFAKISDKYPTWKVVFLGRGDIAKGENLSKQLKIESQIEFKGWVSDKEKSAYFSKSSIFCLPSYGEGLPQCILDAWSYKIPVITTPVGGIPDVITNNVNGMLCNPGDCDQLSLIIEKLIQDVALRETLVNNTTSFVENEFSLETITNRLSELYLKLL
jgi:glycosyltransferase involved in cell wall biosynthesis